ncbi:lytic transglycosylase domain-containing protein [Sphingomonas sp.]|uniref:lytic murein transglycosylase n=1 Tax=Sphingomonas sp. TaxID=28214 RepID=UPI0025D64247|nr:lytic murein transglycosylase [Sphingomonas sp.]
MSALQAWAALAMATAAVGSASPDGQTALGTYGQPAYPQPAYAQPAPIASPWQTYKVRLSMLARQQGVRESTIQANIPGLDVNQRVIDLDQAEPRAAQPGVRPSMAAYLSDHVTPRLIARGQERYSSDYSYLQTIRARYGVDPAVLMAIYGHETSYGTVTGSHDLLETLASLAYGGRRRELFEREFIASLKLIDQGVPRWMLKGSWAGATGYPQFLPSVALRLRADGDGDGYADIWRSEVDGLASIASYLRDAGWKPGVAWGVQARVPLGLNRAALQSRITAAKCPQVYRRHSRWLTVGQWRSLGVVPVEQRLGDNEMATLLEPDGPTGSGYLLSNNYRTILDYNCSNFYAMSVGLLADAIARR